MNLTRWNNCTELIGKLEMAGSTILELIELAEIAESIDKEDYDGRQLRLNFERDPELKKKSEESKREAAPKGERETEKRLIKRLQQGERSSFCGGLMHNLYLQEVDFEELLSPFPLTDLPGLILI